MPASCYPAGAADGSLKVWDKRKLGPDGGNALFTFNHHTGAVLRAEWSPSAPGELHMPAHQDLLAAHPCSKPGHISHVLIGRIAQLACSVRVLKCAMASLSLLTVGTAQLHVTV